MKELFEIHAPGLNTQEIAAGVEARVAARAYDPLDLERVRDLSFTPVSPAREQGFDPAITAELFERPVAPPDFTSAKYRRIRGPFKRLARRVFHFLSNLHDKLSQNKIQAFYNVVHELIAVNHRAERLNERLNALSAAVLTRAAPAATAGSSGVRRELLPLAPAALRSLDEALARECVQILGAEAAVLCPGDRYAHLAQELRRAGLRPRVLLADAAEAQMLAGALGVETVVGFADAVLAATADATLAGILIPDLLRLPGRLELLPELAGRKLRVGGLLYLRVDQGVAASPFMPAAQHQVDVAALREVCAGLDFSLVRESAAAGLRAGSVELLFQKTR